MRYGTIGSSITFYLQESCMERKIGICGFSYLEMLGLVFFYNISILFVMSPITMS